MDFWAELAKQIPSLGVLSFLVWKFLDYIKGRDKAQTAIQESTNEVMIENTKALTTLHHTIQSMES